MQNTTKEHTSVNNVGGVMDLVICMSSDDVLYLHQAPQKYLKGFHNYETDTKIYKRGIIPQHKAYFELHSYFLCIY